MNPTSLTVVVCCGMERRACRVFLVRDGPVSRVPVGGVVGNPRGREGGGLATASEKRSVISVTMSRGLFLILSPQGFERSAFRGGVGRLD